MAKINVFFVLALVASAACTRWYGYAPAGASEKEQAKPAPADKADKGESKSKGEAKAAPAPAFTAPHLECEGGDKDCREVGLARLRQMTVRRGEDRRTYLQHQVDFDRGGCEKVGSALHCGESWNGWVSMMDQRELAQIARSKPKAAPSAPVKKPAAKKECEDPAAPAPAAKAEVKPAEPAKPAALAAPASASSGGPPAPPADTLGGEPTRVEVE